MKKDFGSTAEALAVGQGFPAGNPRRPQSRQQLSRLGHLPFLLLAVSLGSSLDLFLPPHPTLSQGK